jgi:hypothetical protein
MCCRSREIDAQHSNSYQKIVKNMKTLRIPLRIVFYKEDEQWIAHCLEFDVAGNGDTKFEAAESLVTAMRIQVEQSIKHNNSRNLFSPADGRYFGMFAAGRDIAKAELKIKFEPIDSVIMEEPEAREYSEGDLVMA